MTHIVTNKGLMALLRTSDVFGTPATHGSLPGVIETAEFIDAEGCYFIDGLYRHRGNATLDLLHDETGFECFVNHIHLDDYEPRGRLAVALHLCATIEERWSASSYRSMTLRQIVSSDEVGWVYRCHVLREGQSWISANLGHYQELVVVVDSASNDG